MSVKLGLVLAGGGARGAFEVGVLCWIASERPDLLEQIRVITGTSVGAINATFLASRGVTPEGVAELEAIWLGLKLEEIAQLRARRVVSLLRRLGTPILGRSDAPPLGLLDSGPFHDLILGAVDWQGLREVVASRRLDAVAVAATEIASGRTHVFVDHHDGLGAPRWPSDPMTLPVRTQLRETHVLASSALPVLFSPVKVGRYWFCDGGLRHNVPLSPALRFGADRLVAISLGRRTPPTEPAPDVFPGWAQLAGKLMNSLFLDRMRWDLGRLDRMNAILDSGTALHGETFVPTLQDELRRRGHHPYRVVRHVGIHPDIDFGAAASELLRSKKLHSLLEPVRDWRRLGRPSWLPINGTAIFEMAMRRLLTSAGDRQADLASYLLFDGAFAEVLIAEGRRAAERARGEFDRLLSQGA